MSSDLWERYIATGRRHGSPEEAALAERYFPLALQIARKTARKQSRSTNLRDFVESAAGTALIKAIRAFKPDGPAKFETYLETAVVREAKAAIGSGHAFQPRTELPHQFGLTLEQVQVVLAILKQSGRDAKLWIEAYLSTANYREMAESLGLGKSVVAEQMKAAIEEAKRTHPDE